MPRKRPLTLPYLENSLPETGDNSCQTSHEPRRRDFHQFPGGEAAMMALPQEREKKADLPGKGEVRAAYGEKAMGKRIPSPGGEGRVRGLLSDPCFG